VACNFEVSALKTPSFPEIVNGSAGSRPISDEKMEQVRELLFGEFEKQTETRVVELEARVRELEVGLNRRLDAMEARMEALSGEMDASQLTAQQEIAGGLQELAERVRRIGNI
jgi:hypothetical protein